ncbi:Membrane protein [Cystobacter fuscus DSM 2262]|uniref:Membrane protein n=1 Tax=Cystobacter fuscus (strain ATCC 25194 / DSM 2262 / NBRC 100088 / M29) TaxID=1242864 RepID=S9PCK9_CYSF2|nr:mechanosensitive ion channel family protein [Cystobacter fuscus]EPX60022.1 Membrane protein [Cystobacter fuscus DSM 2262]
MHRNLLVLLVLLSSVSALAGGLNEGLGEPPPEVDRQTPSATVTGFLEAAHARYMALLPHYLWLSHLPPEQQRAEGERLGRRLMFVLDRAMWFDFTRIGQEPLGDAPGATSVSLGQIPLGRGTRDIRLRRVEGPDGAPLWVFSEGTVRAIDALFEEHGSPLLERLPSFFFVRPVWVLELWQWLGLVLLVGVVLLASQVLEKWAHWLGGRAARLTKSGWDDQMLTAGRGPMRFALVALLGAAGSRLLLLPPPAQKAVDLGARSLALVSAAWFVLRFVKLSAGFLEQKVVEQAGEDVGRARGLRTQLVVMRRIIEAATYVIAASLLLLQFEAVRNVGVSLLASAGIAGLVLGLAAQKSISTLLAGIQLSLTQPVRIGDTVIVENEWGWIEEITLTYVVVKVWDLRRLVVPMTHFLDKPFQNWSKVSPEILGTAELYVDYRTDVAAVRAELSRILHDEGRALWDGKVQGLQVTGFSERTMTLRALVSAADSGKAFDLRCLVRERLIAYLQRQPAGLPVVRAEALFPAEAVESRTAPVLPSTGGRNVVAPGGRAE